MRTYDAAWLDQIRGEEHNGINPIYGNICDYLGERGDCGRVLEVGCGPGTLLDTFKTKCVKFSGYLGVDRDIGLLNVARQKYGLKFTEMDICKDPTDFEYLAVNFMPDYIFAIRLFNYLDDICLISFLNSCSKASFSTLYCIIPKTAGELNSETQKIDLEFHGAIASHYLRHVKTYESLLTEAFGKKPLVEDLSLRGTPEASHTRLVVNR